MKGIEKINFFIERFKRHGNTWWFYHKLLGYMISEFHKKFHGNEWGVEIMKEKWNHLIILDSCRWDTFCEVYGKKVGYRISKGSNTFEFIKKNFEGKKFLDTIYITANPVISAMCKDNFYKIIHVWKTHWNDKIGTVLPKDVYRISLKIKMKYPNKRLIIHFNQPHYPFISFYLENRKRDNLYVSKKRELNELYEYYRKDVKLVLKYALNFAKKVKGKTIITSDHGECFGEFLLPFFVRFYGHKDYLHVEPLLKIPWLEIYTP